MNFERFTEGRLFAISATVKHWESPGKAGGLPRLVIQFCAVSGTCSESCAEEIVDSGASEGFIRGFSVLSRSCWKSPG